MNKPNLYKCGLRKRPTNGKLLQDNVVIHYDKPFALLQTLKTNLINSGVNSKTLKIVNL